MVYERNHYHTIDTLLSEQKDDELRTFLNELAEEELAYYINKFRHGKKKLFKLLSPEKRREVIWDLDRFSRQYVLNALPNREVKELVEEMDSDDASDIAYLLPASRRKSLLRTLPRQDSKEIEDILQYPETSAGHIMQKELVKVPEYFSVLDTIKRIQRMQDEVKNMSFIFVTDNRGIFKGYVPLEKLVIAQPRTKIKELISGDTSVLVSIDQEEAAHQFKLEDLPALPVVDENHKLVGTITSDDIVDVLVEEQSEDMYQMAGVDKEESVFDSPLRSAKRRLPWLVVNLGTAILAAFVVSLFQDTIQRVVILAAYMPIVAGMGGNAATQAITIIVRAIALKEVQFHDVAKVLSKEIGIGIVNGVSLGLLIGCISYLYNGNIMLGVVIGLAMIINLLIAGISGTIIPLTLKALRLDPALASSVFVTTCTDVGGFLSFLGLATILL